MADEVENEEEKPKRSIVKTLALILGGPILIGAGFAGGFFFAGSQSTPSEEVLKLIEQSDPDNVVAEGEELGEDGEPQKNTKDIPEEEKFVTTYYEFPEAMTTNLAGSTRFLQVGLGISTQYDDQVIANVETHKLALRSDILAVMSNYSEADVAGKEGRDALADALRDALNERLTELEDFGGVEGVFFKSFVLQ